MSERAAISVTKLSTLTIVWSIGACCWLWSTPAISGAPATAKKVVAKTIQKTIILEQVGTLAGKQTIYLSADAIRIDNRQRRTITISSAPNWQVISYNTSSKKYFELPFAKYHGMMTNLFLFYGIDMTAYDFKLLRTSEILGHPCSILKPIAKESTARDDVKLANSCKSFWVAEDLPAPKQAADLLAKQLSLPASHKVPLRMDYYQNLASTHALETVKWSEADMPKDWFKLPAGIIRAKRESDVLVNDPTM